MSTDNGTQKTHYIAGAPAHRYYRHREEFETSVVRRSGPGQINLGLARYGRTYKLVDPGCTEIGCQFKGPGAAGRCTAYKGVLSSYEITQMWLSNGYQQHLNNTATVKCMVYDNDNSVGFDDIETHHMK